MHNLFNKATHTTKNSSRGQIVSLDFLMGAGVMLLAIGLLLGYAETSAYREKQSTFEHILDMKTEAAVIAFSANPATACIAQDTNTLLAYSVDMAKINTIASNATKRAHLKNQLGLTGANARITITSDLTSLTTTLFSDSATDHTYAIDVPILICQNSTTINNTALIDCARGTCNTTLLQTGTLHIEVSA